MNVVGGYVVTDRMLQMFRKKPVAPQGRRADDAEAGVVTTLEIVEILVRIALAGRARSAFVIGLVADELAGDRPQRQPRVGRPA